MLQVEGVFVAFGGENLLENISFSITAGERCGLVGRNGSGKTTLMRVITGQEKPDGGTLSLPKGYELGYLDQHIRFSSLTVLQEACLGLRADERDHVYKAEKMLSGLGFDAAQIELSPERLSGGYHLRLHLAKVLLSEPDCLLLDEPTNYLDILSLRFLTHFLKQWKGEMLVISHDREFMDGIITHTLGIHRKKIRKVKGTTEDYYNRVLQEEMVHERTRANLEKKKAHLQSYIDRFGAKATKAAQAQARRKQIEKMPALEELKALHNLEFSFPESPFHGKKMADASHLFFSYQKEKPLIRDFSLMVEKGEKVAIIGKNGYGKSTLLRLLAGDLAPAKGAVWRSDQAQIGYFGQTNIDRLNPSHTIEEEIISSVPELAFSEVRRICGQMLFSGDKAKKKIAVLSGGEKSRVLLGKILAKPSNLLLLDEPTHHLDIESVEALIDALEDYSGSVVIVTHSELILKRLHLDKIIACHQHAQSYFLGDYESFLEKVGWEEEGSKDRILEVQMKKPAEKKPHRDHELKALKKEIGRLEKEIERIEKEREKRIALLIEVSRAGQSEAMQELLKKNAENEKSLEDLYDKLAKATEEFEKNLSG